MPTETNPNAARPQAPHVILTLAGVVIILGGIKAAEVIVTPLLLALFIAAVSSPVYFWLLNRRVPVAVALMTILFSLLLLGAIMSALVSGALLGFTEKLPAYEARLSEVWLGLLQWLGERGITYDPAQLAGDADPAQLLALAGNALNGLISLLTGTFFILLLLAFILSEMTLVQKKIRAVSQQPAQSLARFGHFLNTLTQYFAMKAVVSFATGVLVYIWLLLFDIDYPILWALVAFILNFVPTIGSLMAAVPAVLLGLVQFGFGTALWVVLGYFLVNNLIGNLIEPRLLGRRLGLSVFVVFMSLVLWGWLLGPVGMFLAVPLTITAKIAFESSPGTAWLGTLLGNTRELEKQPE